MRHESPKPGAGGGAGVRPSVVLGLAAAAALTALVEPGAAVTVVIVVPFLLVGPGLAVIAPLRLGELVAEFTLTVAVSLALELLIATAMLYAELWSPEAILLVLAGLSAMAAIPQLVLSRRPAGLEAAQR